MSVMTKSRIRGNLYRISDDHISEDWTQRTSDSCVLVAIRLVRRITMSGW
jgi:hypothetical protein